MYYLFQQRLVKTSSIVASRSLFSSVKSSAKNLSPDCKWREKMGREPDSSGLSRDETHWTNTRRYSVSQKEWLEVRNSP